jgi:nitrite reductase (NADH) small subunit
VISLESGQALGADKGAVRTYALRIEKGRLLLDATAVATAHAA